MYCILMSVTFVNAQSPFLTNTSALNVLIESQETNIGAWLFTRP
jgi:hypothetical protein